jgi:hypothetical protein
MENQVVNQVNNNKQWYKSKTVWIAVTMLVITILKANGVEIPPSVNETLIALGLIVVRSSDIPLK